MADVDKPGLNLLVDSKADSGTPVPTTTAVGTPEAGLLSAGPRIMPASQDGSEGQSADSGFILPVEQVLEMQQQHNADLKQLLITFSRHFQVPRIQSPT